MGECLVDGQITLDKRSQILIEFSAVPGWSFLSKSLNWYVSISYTISGGIVPIEWPDKVLDFISGI